MNRATWLEERRQEAEERYSTWWAPEYGEKWGNYPNSSHLQFIQKFLDRLPQNSSILNAACGAGRYIEQLLEKGHTVTGIDQAAGMLARAKEFFPQVQFDKVGMQAMSFQDVFDGAICMDAMEHICPEDWTVIVRNFHRALKQGGCLYFTVEIADEAEVKTAFEEAKRQGFPVVYGEWVNDEVYHYYPSLEQVREWIQQADFSILEEGEGDLYHHFLMRKT